MIQRNPFRARFSDSAAAPAFTIIELCIGLAITALILGALAAFISATGQAWSDTGSGRAAAVQGWQFAQRLLQTVHTSQLTCACVGGDLGGSSTNTAALVLWQNDNNTDGNIQLSELEVLAIDPAGYGTYLLNLYTLPQGSPDAQWNYSVLTNPSCIPTLKSLMTATPLAAGLSGAHFNAQSATLSLQRPLVEFALAMPVNGQSQTIYLSACIRAPLPAPNN
jgi:hypothetical protein